MLHRVDLRLFEIMLQDILQLKYRPNLRLSRSIKLDGDICYGLYEGEYIGRGKYIHTIRLNKSQILDNVALFATLAHEYVHAWQMENDYEVDHEDSYIKWCAVFHVDYGVDITNMI